MVGVAAASAPELLALQVGARWASGSVLGVSCVAARSQQNTPTSPASGEAVATGRGSLPASAGLTETYLHVMSAAGCNEGEATGRRPDTPSTELRRSPECPQGASRDSEAGRKGRELGIFGRRFLGQAAARKKHPSYGIYRPWC